MSKRRGPPLKDYGLGTSNHGHERFPSDVTACRLDVEISSDTTKARCLACKLYDPEDLGSWISRKSVPGHLKSITHRDYVAQQDREQQERQQGDAIREAAYAAPRSWSPSLSGLATDYRPPPAHVRVEVDDPMEGQSARQAPFADDLELPEHPQRFDYTKHKELLRDEVELLLHDIDEEELGLWDEEEDEAQDLTDDHADSDGVCLPCATMITRLTRYTNQMMHYHLMSSLIRTMHRGPPSLYVLVMFRSASYD
jgi:hypothetical protein